MNKSSNSVPNLEIVGNCGTDLLDNTAAVTPDNDALGGEKVNVLVVSGIEADCDRLRPS